MELSFSELLVVGLIALLVLGPTEMVVYAERLGRWIGKFRTQVHNFKILAHEQILSQRELNLQNQQKLQQANAELLLAESGVRETVHSVAASSNVDSLNHG